MSLSTMRRDADHAQRSWTPVRRLRWSALAALLLAAAPAGAHPLAPALLEVVQRPSGAARVTWQTSRLALRGAHVVPVLPASCTPLAAPRTTARGVARRTRWSVGCAPGGLVGATLAIDGLASAGHDALVRVQLADGRVVQRLLTAEEPRMIVPPRPRPRDVLRDYGALGVRHILSGLDHLLFVFGLVLLGGTLGRVAGTVSAFTVGHSVTLSLAALGLADVPAAPVEALIALSVWLLALEVAHAPERRGPIARWPWIAAAGFGLLHGLGFAGALREAGLPSGDVPLALVGFNAGVELGQLAFVVAVLAALAAVARVPRPLPAWVRGVPVTAMGALATYWCLERVAVLVG